MAAPLVDPLSMKASDVVASWKTSQPGKKNGGAVFVGRIEAICKAEAAKHGFDQVLICSIPHDTTTQPGVVGFVQDVMHITARFTSRYFTPETDCGRTVHIPVNMYDPVTKKWSIFEMKSKNRGPDYPYKNLAMEGQPTYTHMAMQDNPFPKFKRQNGQNRASRQSTPTSRPATPASGRTAGRTTPSPPHSRPTTPSGTVRRTTPTKTGN